jgi:hypothetical protein
MHGLALLFLQDETNHDAMRAAMAMLAIMPVIFLVCVAIIIVPCWFICKKAGFSPWLSLLNLIPMGGLVLLYILAFAEWKVVPAPQGWVPQAPYPPYPPQV